MMIDSVSFDGKSVMFFDELGTPHSYDPDTQIAKTLAAGAIHLKSHGCMLTVTVEPYSGELKVN
jgi:hypothetical protein